MNRLNRVVVVVGDREHGVWECSAGSGNGIEAMLDFQPIIVSQPPFRPPSWNYL